MKPTSHQLDLGLPTPRAQRSERSFYCPVCQVLSWQPKQTSRDSLCGLHGKQQIASWFQRLGTLWGTSNGTLFSYYVNEKIYIILNCQPHTERFWKIMCSQEKSVVRQGVLEKNESPASYSGRRAVEKDPVGVASQLLNHR